MKTIQKLLILAAALTVLLPAFCPKKGGKIKFPAPKKSEKSMKLMSSIFFRSSFMGCILPAHDKLVKNKEKTYADVPKYNTVPTACQDCNAKKLKSRKCGKLLAKCGGTWYNKFSEGGGIAGCRA